VWVEGEISNFKVYGSGHVYFTLKDAGAQIRAVLFRNRTRRIRFEPKDGLHVMAFGAVEVYAQRASTRSSSSCWSRGSRRAPARVRAAQGAPGRGGTLRRRRKRTLPRFPRRIGIVTSPSGAAIKGHAARDRPPVRRAAHRHRPARVQGDGAAEEIAQASVT